MFCSFSYPNKIEYVHTCIIRDILFFFYLFQYFYTSVDDQSPEVGLGLLYYKYFQHTME